MEPAQEQSSPSETASAPQKHLPDRGPEWTQNVIKNSFMESLDGQKWPSMAEKRRVDGGSCPTISCVTLHTTPERFSCCTYKSGHYEEACLLPAAILTVCPAAHHPWALHVRMPAAEPVCPPGREDQAFDTCEHMNFHSCLIERSHCYLTSDTETEDLDQVPLESQDLMVPQVYCGDETSSVL